VATFKGIANFKQSGQGWSEQWWLEVSSSTNALAAMKSYVTQRRKSLTVSARIKSVRVSNADNLRDAQFFSYLGDTGNGTYIAPATAQVGPEFTNAAANIRWFTNTGRWRNLLVRGLPQSALQQAADDWTINSTWFDTYKEVRDLVVATEFRVGTAVYGASTALATINVSGGTMYSFTTGEAIAGAVVEGDVVQIRGTVGVSNLNGLWRVTQVTGLNYYVRPHKKQQWGTLNVLQPGNVRKVTMNLEQLTTAVPVGGTSKKSGRPFGLLRGRASVRRS